LVIAGWDDGGHEQGLREIANRLGLRNVVFVGPQFGQERSKTYAASDAFILPSVSEGLPMTILEAWSFGMPVLMTPECNLPEGFRVGAAWEITSEVPGIVAGIKRLFESTEEQRKDTGARGRLLVEGRFSWTAIGESMGLVYEWLVGRGRRPEAVRLASQSN
jgi:poly(glycerol-phosphate) alpha-glucosyltransferase